MPKSKGGLTNHQRSNHVAELGERSSSSEEIIISTEKIAGLIRDIGRHFIDEKLYNKEHTSEVFELQPSDSFVSFINQVLLKFNRKRVLWQNKFKLERIF